jgi:hypothetical protein
MEENTTTPSSPGTTEMTSEEIADEFRTLPTDEMFAPGILGLYYTTPEVAVLTVLDPDNSERIIHTTVPLPYRQEMARFLELTPQQVHESSVINYQNHPDLTEEMVAWTTGSSLPLPYIPEEYAAEKTEEVPLLLRDQPPSKPNVLGFGADEFPEDDGTLPYLPES